MNEQNETIILVKKSKVYSPKSDFPTVNTSRSTYEKLKRIALKNGLTISEVLRQIVDYAEDHVCGIVEE